MVEFITKNKKKIPINHSKLGRGARVESTQVLGGNLKDIPKGSVGTVTSHFGHKKNPIVKFDKLREVVIEGAGGLKILKSSKIVPNRGQEIFDVKGTKEQLIKKMKADRFSNIDDTGFFHGTIYLDDGEGRTGDASYRGKVSDGRVMVEMLKNDVPRFWHSYYDQLQEQASDEVRSALGVD